MGLVTMIKIERDYLVIDNNEWEYNIKLKQLETIDGLNKWIYHMEEKSWWNKSMTKEMISLCENKFGYNYEKVY